MLNLHRDKKSYQSAFGAALPEPGISNKKMGLPSTDYSVFSNLQPIIVCFQIRLIFWSFQIRLIFRDRLVTREPGRDGKILSDHRQDGNDEVHRLL